MIDIISMLNDCDLQNYSTFTYKNEFEPRSTKKRQRKSDFIYKSFRSN